MKQSNIFFIILVILLGIVIYFSFFESKDGFQNAPTSTNLNNKIASDIDNLVKEVNDLQIQQNSSGSVPVKTTPGYDNYNHYNGGKTMDGVPTVYHGPGGSTAKLMSSNGIYTIVIVDHKGNTTTYSVDATTYKMYYGPHGSSASIIVDATGNKAIKVTDSNGNTIIYSSNNKPVLQLETSETHYLSGTGAANIAPSRIVAQMNQVSSTTPSSYKEAYNTKPTNANPYSNYLPPGIPKSMIPSGDEDLYILKSEVVPPVCPVCPPPVMTCPKNDVSKCPPCKPCGRCPEPSFECKKVPNYSGGNQYLPQPVVNDFSTFGM